MGTTKLVVLHEGWVAAAFEYGQRPLYFWPGGHEVQTIVDAAGADGTAAGTPKAWQAAMARVSAALLAAGFFVIPGGRATALARHSPRRRWWRRPTAAGTEAAHRKRQTPPPSALHAAQ